MGWGTRTLLAALVGLTAAFAPLAWAQETYRPPKFFLSPNGGTIALLRYGDGDDPYEDMKIDLLDTDCVFGGKSADECTRLFAADLFAIRINWARDSQSLIASAGVLDQFYAIDRVDGEPKQGSPLKSGEVTAARIFEPAYLTATEQNKKDRQEGLDTKLYNGRGEFVGGVWKNAASKAYIADIADHTLEFPRGGFGLGEGGRHLWTLPSGPDIFDWVSKQGERGQLAHIRPGGVEMMPVPGHDGPADVVWSASSGLPMAIFDPLHVYPLAGVEDEAGWVKSAFDRMRSDDPALELSSVEISTDTHVAMLGLRDGPGCLRAELVRPDDNVTIYRRCEAWAEGRSKPTVSAVTIPGAGIELKGQLYSWPHAAGQRPRGLLINFHGGPMSNLREDGIDFAAQILGDRFDILAVDYRGSTGHGEDYFYSLKQPLAAAAATDLNSVLAWTRSQPGLAGREIGFFGTSWGGLAGYAALSHGAPGLSFIVAHSGFIEAQAQTRSRDCKLKGWSSTVLFGVTTAPDGTCYLSDSGVLGAPLVVRIPLLMLNGAKDHNTTLDIAQDWLSQAHDQDACMSTVISASGEHGLCTWPEASADTARKAVNRWVSDVEAKRPAACRTQIALP